MLQIISLKSIKPYLLLVTLLVGVFGEAFSQTDDKVYTVVDEPAAPKGGMPQFYKYVSGNIRYPSAALKNKTQGKVIVQFIVNADGSLSDINVVKGIGNGCDEEAIRVMKGSPKWDPGKQNGTPVRVRMVVPVIFRLN